ncbi:MAG: hypothetical protein H6936_13240 [Burkholderiales bacterium]|nr:hypothetical protein [Burkholderiales bacterium]
MTKKEKPYKATKNVIIPDVLKAYAKVYDRLRRTKGSEQSATEFFNDLVMAAAADYFGEARAKEMLKGFQEEEDTLARGIARRNARFDIK